MANEKNCYCSNGKTYLVNPNAFNGQGIGDNFSVQTEDLNIYVELTTSKKQRSIITVSDKNVTGTSSTKGKSRVSFIDGTNIGATNSAGKKVKSLTTNYTELTTIFNQTEDTENLGITDINIDFNSSYAPLVTIKFIDVRGKALFNTDTGDGPKSQYALFFDLPYPIFELKVKGYYGKTVKYCLHLTKWNAKFNTQTGNFEITADFIGYTYAMLNDMLLGYLRAITKTKAGRAKFDLVREEMNNPDSLITINELLNRIEDVNSELEKLKADDPDVAELSSNKKIKAVFNNFEDLITITLKKLTKADESSTSGYIQFNHENKLIGLSMNRETKDANPKETRDALREENDKIIADFKTSMESNITQANEFLSEVNKLKVDDYTDVRVGKSHIPKKFLAKNGVNFEEEFDFKNEMGYSQDEFEIVKSKMTILNTYGSSLDFFDFTTVLDKITTFKDKIEKTEEELIDNVGLKLQNKVKEILGFEPTIKNIFRIFTVHSEVFMDCLKEVSEKAEFDVDKTRKGELNKLKDKFSDIRSDIKEDSTLPANIFPWPLYREQSKSIEKNNTFEEAWLGQALKIPQNVPEIVFVEDLLKGLLEVNREDEARLQKTESDGIDDAWYPVSVLDTPLFGVTENPYKVATIGNSTNPIDPLKQMMFRAFTFMGVSNRSNNKAEVEAMGALEAHTALNGIPNKVIRDAMVDTQGSERDAADVIINTFLAGGDKKNNKLTITGTTATPFMSEKTLGGTSIYQYEFIDNTQDGIPNQRIIPMNGDYDGKDFYSEDNQFLSTQLNLNLTGSNVNITTGLANTELFDKSSNGDGDLNFIGATVNGASDHGITFMRIISEEDYNAATSLAPDYTGQEAILKPVAEQKASRYLDGGNLFASERSEASDINGWNQFGDDTSKFGFNTVSRVNFGTLQQKERKGIYTGGEEGGSSKALFYIKMGVHGDPISEKKNSDGATSLSSTEFAQIFNDTSEPFQFDTSQLIVEDGITYYEAKGSQFKGGGHPRRYQQAFPNPGGNRFERKDIGNNRELFQKAEAGDQGVMIPHCDFVIQTPSSNLDSQDVPRIFSLFGSEWYFQQRQSSSPVSAKALLFLHTFPWTDLFTDDTINSGFDAGIFDNNESNIMSNLFGRRGAFIHAPKLWVSFIGGLLWRMDTRDIVRDSNSGLPTWKGGSGTYDPIIWGEPTSTSATAGFSIRFIPGEDDNLSRSSVAGKSEYLTHRGASAPLHLANDGEFKSIDNVLRNLPQQIKDEFVKSFFDFVESDEWEIIRNGYEIGDPNWDAADGTVTYEDNGEVVATWVNGTNDWVDKWEEILECTGDGTSPCNRTRYPKLKVDTLFTDGGTSARNNQGNFISIDLIQISNEFLNENTRLQYHNNYDLAFKADTIANKALTKLFTAGVVIANVSYKPWIDDGSTSENPIPFHTEHKNEIFVTQDSLKLYVQSFVKEWRKINKIDTVKKDKDDDAKQTLFNTMDDDTIRLNIYRHCKSVFDKWIAGSEGNIFTACGVPKDKSVGNRLDKAVMRKDRKENSIPRLIDSFRFVNRAFNDLGDEFLLNPNAIRSVVLDNPNQSFYSLISRVLAENNFNFIALPAFIDYNEPKEICSMFKPQIYDEGLDDAVGPSFVCVYVGQVSNQLDLGNGSTFPSDGFDFKCARDSDGNETAQLVGGDAGAPLDFIKPKKDYEHNVVAFAVNYGHQNQNIFTDIKLDQQEYTETDESLIITDSIANNGSQSNRTLAGQNLWNVYQVRSYSAEVTAMGNVMIQPMMYFQLNNIPMFHGAYHIIHAKHAITPNHMKTTFKGVRTRFIDTKLIDANTMYMSMLGTLSDVDSAGSGGLSVPPDLKFYGNDEEGTDDDYNVIQITR